MKIIPLQYGESVLSEDMIFINGNKNKLRRILFRIYLIVYNEKLILIDAGCETMPGFEMTNFIGSIKALDEIGISPDEITDVIITHAHHDHIECVKYFKNAIIHIQQDEYESGNQYIPDDFIVNIFGDEYEITPDIRVMKIGGHSKGSCVVEINMDNKTYVIVGDECYSRQCLTDGIPTGTTSDQEVSLSFIRHYSDAKYNVLLCHDD